MRVFDRLCNSLYDYYTERKNELKALDRKREKNPDWYKTNGIVGMNSEAVKALILSLILNAVYYIVVCNRIG